MKLQINKIHVGNNIDLIKQLDDCSIDSIVTDPPYGISFMNKKWDYGVPTVKFWVEALRVLKPGGHCLVACGTRTQHRMAVNLEKAGFEIRDIVAWVYGSGFPKSHDIIKAIDKSMGAEREVVGQKKVMGKDDTICYGKYQGGIQDITTPSTDEAKAWQGWGTALKPAMELWTLCRKPIIGTVAQNILMHGVGGLNIDGCRVETDDDIFGVSSKTSIWGDGNSKQVESNGNDNGGRFPANFIHDGSEEVVKLFPNDNDDSAARFFYTAKASQTERNWGLGEFDEIRQSDRKKDDGVGGDNPRNRSNNAKRNFHPTVKPIDLMRYLVRLVTPKGGLCLDPFMGSGTTAIACKGEKINYIGFELDEEYVIISEARIKAEMVIYNIFDFIEEREEK